MKIFVAATEFLSPQQVVQLQSDLIFLRLVAATKFCCGDKDFHKTSSVRTKQFVAATYRLTVLLQLQSPELYTPSDLSPRRVTATCRLVCTDL